MTFDQRHEINERMRNYLSEKYSVQQKQKIYIPHKRCSLACSYISEASVAKVRELKWVVRTNVTCVSKCKIDGGAEQAQIIHLGCYSEWNGQSSEGRRITCSNYVLMGLPYLLVKNSVRSYHMANYIFFLLRSLIQVSFLWNEYLFKSQESTRRSRCSPVSSFQSLSTKIK